MVAAINFFWGPIAYRFCQLVLLPASELELIRGPVLLGCCRWRLALFILHSSKEVVEAHRCIGVVGHWRSLFHSAFAKYVECEGRTFLLGLLRLDYLLGWWHRGAHPHAHGGDLRDESTRWLLLHHIYLRLLGHGLHSHRHKGGAVAGWKLGLTGLGLTLSRVGRQLCE